MRVAFYTLGCKLNQLETEALASSFGKQGFLIVEDKSEADIYILNSCTVTSKSDQKSRKWIRYALKKNPNSLVIATGCYAELESDKIVSLGSRVLSLGQDDKALLLKLPSLLKRVKFLGNFSSLTGEDKKELVKGIIRREKERINTDSVNRFVYTLNHFNFHSRAFIKIQDGCDYRCSYCRVPLARGKSVSLDYNIVVKRILELSENGYEEIVLTGVNIASYNYDDCDFPCLLDRVLKSGVTSRIRLSSIEPEKIDDRLAEIISDSRICPHFHIPVQSFSDRVLKRMRRRYNGAIFERLFGLLRRIKEDPFIAFDIIAGFPGETEEDFYFTYEMVERYRPARVHVFPYSPRSGTDAFLFSDRVPERIRDLRVKKLLVLSKELEREYAMRWIKREVSIVVERVNGSMLSGVSENYLRVFVESDGGYKVGDVVRVQIIGVNDRIHGQILGK